MCHVSLRTWPHPWERLCAPAWHLQVEPMLLVQALQGLWVPKGMQRPKGSCFQ